MVKRPGQRFTALISIFHAGLLLAILLSSCNQTPAPPPDLPTPPSSSITSQPVFPTSPLPTLPPFRPAVTVTPRPTLDARQEVEDLLNSTPYDYCPTGSYDVCTVPYAVRILEFLTFENPTPEARKSLTTRLLGFTGYGRGPLNTEWLVQAWMDENILQPIQKAGGLTPAVNDLLKQNVNQMQTVDLNGDRRSDYLLTLRFFNTNPGNYDPQVGLYWLNDDNGQYTLQLIQHGPAGQGLKILSTQDLTGDQSGEIAYTTNAGCSGCLVMHISTLKDNKWNEIPIAAGSDTALAWEVHVRPDQPAELVGAFGNIPDLTNGPLLSYYVHYRFQEGMFLPADISLLSQSSDSILLLQWAQKLIEAHRLSQAMAIYTGQSKFNGPGIDYTPYALFQQGMLQLFNQDVNGALKTWLQLVNLFPDNPAAQAAIQFRALVKKPEDAWQVCAWLNKNNSDQFLPGTWIPAPTGLVTTPTPSQPITATQTITPAVIVINQPTSTKTTSIVPTQQINLLGLPLAYRLPLSWQNMCSPYLLISMQAWNSNESIETQVTRTGLTWNQLSDAYDLNGDGTPDPIGAISGTPWVMLSSAGSYRAMDAAQPLPWVDTGLLPGQLYLELSQVKSMQVLDLEGNQKPQLLVTASNWMSVNIWNGDHFSLNILQFTNSDGLFQSILSTSLKTGSDGKQQLVVQLQNNDEWIYEINTGQLSRVQPAPDTNGQQPILTSALLALYREKDPAKVQTLLENYASQDRWMLAAARTLRALALKHNGQAALASQEFTEIARKYSETGWASLVKSYR